MNAVANDETDLPIVALDGSDLLSNVYFPKPVVLVSTLDSSGQPNLAPYSQLFPHVVGGTVQFQLVCRATSNTAQNLMATSRATLNFMSNDAAVMAHVRRLAVRAPPHEKMADNPFSWGTADEGPGYVLEALQVLECEVVSRCADEDTPECRPEDQCFTLRVRQVRMAPEWQRALETGVGSPPLAIDFGLRRPDTPWVVRPPRQVYVPRLRPRFESSVVLGPDVVLARFEQALQRPVGPVRGHIVGRHIQLSMEESIRKLGSPQMELEVVESSEGTTLKGRIGPNPHVWTLFLALHAVVAFLALAGLFYGIAQWKMDGTPWALVSLPVAAGLHMFIAGAAFIGQGLSMDQTYQMRVFMDDVLSAPPNAPPER